MIVVSPCSTSFRNWMLVYPTMIAETTTVNMKPVHVLLSRLPSGRRKKKGCPN